MHTSVLTNLASLSLCPNSELRTNSTAWHLGGGLHAVLHNLERPPFERGLTQHLKQHVPPPGIMANSCGTGAGLCLLPTGFE